MIKCRLATSYKVLGCKKLHFEDFVTSDLVGGATDGSKDDCSELLICLAREKALPNTVDRDDVNNGIYKIPVLGSTKHNEGENDVF